MGQPAHFVHRSPDGFAGCPDGESDRPETGSGPSVHPRNLNGVVGA